MRQRDLPGAPWQALPPRITVTWTDQPASFPPAHRAPRHGDRHFPHAGFPLLPCLGVLEGGRRGRLARAGQEDPPLFPLLGRFALQANSGGSSCADRKSTRLNSSHVKITYAVLCMKSRKGEG